MTCSMPGKFRNYGYGRLANVFTSLEFERLTNAAGPTGGKIVLRDGVTVPKSRWHYSLCWQPRQELPQLLLGHLLHAESEICPPGKRKDRR